MAKSSTTSSPRQHETKEAYIPKWIESYISPCQCKYSNQIRNFNYKTKEFYYHTIPKETDLPQGKRIGLTDELKEHPLCGNKVTCNSIRRSPSFFIYDFILFRSLCSH